MQSKKRVTILTRLSLALASLTALLCLSSCGTIEIKNFDFYGDKGSLGAVKTNFYNGGISKIEKSVWDTEIPAPDHRFGMYCMAASDFLNIKDEIEKLCSAYGKCVWPTGESQNFFINANKMMSAP